MKNYSNKNKDNKQKKYQLVLEIKISNQLFMKDNLIDLSKIKDRKDKKNSNKIGKKDKKQELIFFIKSLMTDKRKLKNIKKLNKNNLDKNNKTDYKLKEESNNMKLNKIIEEKHNLKNQKYNKVNYFNKLLKNKKNEDLFYYNSKENNTTCKMLDKTIVIKQKKEKEKEENNYKISKKLQDYIDVIFFRCGYKMIK